MWQTTRAINSRTYKEIDNRHTIICIDDVEAVDIYGFNNRIRVNFCMNNNVYASKEFATKEEAIKFRDKIMGWEEVKQ